MKCPKCGSNIVKEEYNKYQCAICLYKWEDIPKPTIAEKLLWLVKKFSVSIIHDYTYCALNGKEYELKKLIINCTKTFEAETVDEVISEAYKWVKEQKKCGQ